MSHANNSHNHPQIELPAPQKRQSMHFHPLPQSPNSPNELNICHNSNKAKTDSQTNYSTLATSKKPSFLSNLHFVFAFKLVKFINSLKKRNVNEDDLKSLIYVKKSRSFENMFTLHYYELRAKHGGKFKLLALVLYKIFKRYVYIQLIWQVLYVCSRILIPYFLYLSMKSVRNPDKPIGDAYPPAVGMFLCFILGHYSDHQLTYNAAVTSNGMKIGLLGMMYRKLGKISLLSLQKMSFGKVINVVASDSNNLENIHYILFLVITPLTFGGSITVLCHLWGPSALAGIGYMIVIFILQKILSEMIFPPGKLRSFYVDERVRKINETLEAIRVIKMQTWEAEVLDSIHQVRVNEIKYLKKINIVLSVMRALTYSSQYIAAFFILLVYTETDNSLTSVKIFPSILLLGYLRQLAMVDSQVGFTYIVLMKSLFLRIMSIMDLPEVNPSTEVLSPISPLNSVEFHDFSGYWPLKDLGPPPFLKPPSLRNQPPPTPAPIENSISPTPVISRLNLGIKKGDFVAVIGRTGSGKSSLLLSFTKEMAKTEGELRYAGRFEYVAQDPVVLAVSIRDIITFGRPYDEELFKKVVKACCLTSVIASLPKKEMSEVGERGVNLSTAQKIQLTLARSLYTKADIYLIDDPFSSLDSRLCKLIFKRVIQGFLKDMTVILVTSNLNFVKHANQIVVLDTGKVIAQGTYSDFSKGEVGSQILEELKERIKHEKHGAEHFGQGRNYDEIYNPLLEKRESEMKQKTGQEAASINVAQDDNGLFIENERIDDGRVTLKIYWKYFRTIFNWWNIVPFTVLFVAAEASGWQFMIRTSDWILGQYTNSEAYGILGGIAFGPLLIHLVKFSWYFSTGLNGACRLHDEMIKGIVHSPMRFFDRNRLGRILNRFANDVSLLDRFLLPALLDVIEGFCLFMVYLIALWVHTPWIMVPGGIAFVFFVLILWWSSKAINQTRGLELTMRGPVYSFFSFEVNGLAPLRARNQNENLINAFFRRADNFSQANIAYKASLRVMSFLLDYITEFAVIGAFCFYIQNKDTNLSSGPFVNILISLPTTMQWILRSFVNLHSLMATPARVINYCQNYKAIEFVKPGDDQLAQSGWPHGGEIDIQHVNFRYGEREKLAIKDLSLNIKPGEKIAIVGYSSFGMTSILRMLVKTFHIDRLPNSHVKIDNVDLENIGVTLLRRSMTIITQDTSLFTGTIRENIDPFGKYTDEEIWKALAAAELKEYIEGFDRKLDVYYVKGCSLLSAGQRQLLCLARSIIKKNSSIVIQDRATHHVDLVTDQLVQKNLREMYGTITNLATTYRIWTLADYDRIMCMKDGVLVEFDEPYRLLVTEIGDKKITNKNGHFAKLVVDMNPKAAKETFKSAMIAYYKKHNLSLDEEEVFDGVTLSGTVHRLGTIASVPSGHEEGEENGEIKIKLEKEISKVALEAMEKNYLY